MTTVSAFVRRIVLTIVVLATTVTALALTPASAAAPASDFDGVHRLYCAFFLREPDGAGIDYWRGLRNDGIRLEVIAENFALSQEFRNTYGKQVSAEDFVSLIYDNLFDRQPDRTGFDYWIEVLDGGFPRGQLMTYFSESQEYKNRLSEVGCSGSANPGGGGDGSRDPSVSARLAPMTRWDTPIKNSADDRALRTMTSAPKASSNNRVRTTCTPQNLPTLSRSFDEFPAFAFAGPTLPGLVVEGSGVTQGDLRVLPLQRSGLRLVSDADSANPVRRLADPTTATIQTAVSQLKRDADARLTGIDVVSSDITYSKEEVHSFEEASLQAGVSLHYENALTEADFNLDFKQTSSVEKHSIVVRLVQPMFKIEMERDTFSSPEDYFSSSVTEEQLVRLESQGRIGVDNPPVLIDTVTYGRIMMFTMTSESAASSSELQIAVSAAHKGISGEANLTDRQRNLLRTSSVQMIAKGGDQGLAFAAIRSGNLNDFFGPANTTTAAPLTMTMRTLDGARVDVADNATLKRVLCSDTYAPFQFRLQVTDLWHANAKVVVNGKNVSGTITAKNRAGSAWVSSISDSHLRPGWNDVEFQLREGTCGWLFDNEAMKAFVYRRGDSTEGWGGNVWNKSFDGTACYFTWKVKVNTITGQVKNG